MKKYEKKKKEETKKEIRKNSSRSTGTKLFCMVTVKDPRKACIIITTLSQKLNKKLSLC